MDHVWGDGVLDSEPLNQNYMNRDQAKKMLPIIQAFAEGKAIQILYLQNVWTDGLEFSFELNPTDYRIKPVKLRPWTQADALPLFGVALLRDKWSPGNKEGRCISLMIGCNETEAVVYNPGHQEWLTYDELLQCAEYSIDRGKTWLPCGIQE